MELIKIEITCSHFEHRSKALALGLVQEQFYLEGSRYCIFYLICLEFESANLDTTYNDYVNIFSKALQSASENSTNAKTTDNGVEYSSKTTYNGYNTNAKIWAKSNSTQIGDMKILNRNGKQFVLIEATEDGYIEIISGNYERIKQEYEQAYNRANNEIYGNIKKIRSNKGRDIWNMLSDKDRGYSNRNSGSNRKGISKSNTTTDNKSLREDNQEISKSVKENSQYINAVNNGDMQTAQRMLDNAAMQ